jgi:PAS domain-containing protein
MEPLEPVQPRVKQNLLLIRVLLTLALALLFTLPPRIPADLTPYVIALLATALLSFIPLAALPEEKIGSVRYQYIFFSLDLAFLLAALYLTDLSSTPFLLCVFLTFFMSALSQSVGRSIAVALAVNGLYYYLLWMHNPVFNPNQPSYLLTSALLFVVAIHSGYLAYRAVQEEKELVLLARKATFLTEKVREAGEAGQEYAMTFKKVLDSLPLGAVAVSKEGNVLLVNASAAKILNLNPRSITNVSILRPSPLREIGTRMAQAMHDQQEIKREYLDLEWDNRPKRFRLDSAFGKGTHGEYWGMLFLVQEAIHPTPATDQAGA